MADKKPDKPNPQVPPPQAAAVGDDQDAVEAALAEAQASIREIQQVAQTGGAGHASDPEPLDPDALDPTGLDPDASRSDAAFALDDSPLDPGAIDLLGDVELQVMVELGRTHMMIEDVLRLGEGAVVELDKLAGDPVDVYVNNRLVARGEVLVLTDNFCIRISEIVADLEQQVQSVARQEVGA
jgi:flagellar motor switch protein FliN/FliY